MLAGIRGGRSQHVGYLATCVGTEQSDSGSQWIARYLRNQAVLYIKLFYQGFKTGFVNNLYSGSWTWMGWRSPTKNGKVYIFSEPYNGSAFSYSRFISLFSPNPVETRYALMYIHT